MKKLIWMAAFAAIFISCNSRGNQQQGIIAESETDSLYWINDSTIGDLQTFIYEGLLPMANGQAGNYQLTIQSIGLNADGTYDVTTTYSGSDGSQQQMSDNGQTIVLIGIPNDSTAVIYELVSANNQPQINLRAQGDSVLTKVDKDFKKVSNDVKHKLTRNKRKEAKANKKNQNGKPNQKVNNNK